MKHHYKRISTLKAPAMALLATLGISAQAIEPEEATPSEKPAFEEIDRNVDGTISMDEATGSWLAGAFRQVDVDQDGYVSKSEYRDATS